MSQRMPQTPVNIDKRQIEITLLSGRPAKPMENGKVGMSELQNP